MDIKKYAINQNQVVSFRVFLNRRDKDFEYRKQIKLFGIVFRKSGFYYRETFDFYPIAESQIEQMENHVIRNENVYFKPHIQYSMVDGSVFNKYFESDTDLDDFLNYKCNPEFSEFITAFS